MKKPYLISTFLLFPLLHLFGQEETLHSWTDLQGRTLQASFLSFDEAAQTVTIKLSNGVVYPAPLNTLSAESQALARQLGAPKLAPALAPSSPFDEVVAEVVAEADLGPEALDLEHDWESADGRSLKAKFVSLQADQLSLARNGGAQEFTLEMSKFSDESQTLAKLLQALAEKHRPAPPAAKTLASKPEKVVPPKVVEADLDKVHSWVSAAGDPLQATFVSADDNEITLSVPRRSSPYVLSWDKLSAQSVALGKALQKLKKSLVPTILSGNEKALDRYGSGKWGNYNCYLESVAFEAGVVASGRSAHVWLLKDGQRVQKDPYNVTFYGEFRDRGGHEHRKLKSLAESPPVSNDRKTTTVKGEWDNGTTFEFNFELTHAGLSFWGEAKEPSSVEFPTILVIRVKSPSVLADAKNATIEDVKKASGDGALYVDPVQGKRLKFPFDESWKEIQAKLTKGGRKDVEYNPVKYAEFNGEPFGDHRIKFEPSSTRKANLVWWSGYAEIYPVQGAYLLLRNVDGSEALKDYANAAKYKDRLEIGRGERLVMKVIRGS